MTDDTKEISESPAEPAPEFDQTSTEGETVNGGDRSKRPLILAAVVVVGLIVIVTAAIWTYQRRKTDVATDQTESPVVSVKVTKAERAAISSEVSAPGTVAPVTQSTVSSTISAQITQMRQLKNVVVQKGEVIAVLASQDLRAQRDEAQAALNEARLNLETLLKVTVPQAAAQSQREVNDAQAALDNARSTYERRGELYRKGGISLKELESSKLVLTNAENALRLAQQNSRLNRTAVNPNARAIAEARIKQSQDRLNAIQAQTSLAEIRAPITGVVTEQFQFEGEMASSGARLLTIADLSQVIVKAQFADNVAAGLNQGDMVTVYPAGAPDERMTGKVTLISRSSDPQNRTVEVWATFGNPRGLLTMGGATQFIVTDETINDAVVIPLAAVTLDAANGESGKVMTVDKDSVAHEAKVKIGVKQGSQVQIVKGLSGGETVVVEGNYALPDGTKVEIAKAAEAGDEGAKDK